MRPHQALQMQTPYAFLGSLPTRGPVQHGVIPGSFQESPFTGPDFDITGYCCRRKTNDVDRTIPPNQNDPCRREFS